MDNANGKILTVGELREFLDEGGSGLPDDAMIIFYHPGTNKGIVYEFDGVCVDDWEQQKALRFK